MNSPAASQVEGCVPVERSSTNTRKSDVVRKRRFTRFRPTNPHAPVTRCIFISFVFKRGAKVGVSGFPEGMVAVFFVLCFFMLSRFLNYLHFTCEIVRINNAVQFKIKTSGLQKGLYNFGLTINGMKVRKPVMEKE